MGVGLAARRSRHGAVDAYRSRGPAGRRKQRGKASRPFAYLRPCGLGRTVRGELPDPAEEHACFATTAGRRL